MQDIFWPALILFFSNFFSNTGIAQREASSALEKIYTAYSRQHTIRFKGTLSMYIKNEPAKTIERIESDYLIRGSNFTCSIGPVTMLRNDKYYVSVDNSVKIIMIGYNKDLSGTEQLPALNVRQFQQLITDRKLQANVIPQGNLSKLELNDKTGATGYSRYDIFYDERTGYMQKVQMETSDYNDVRHKTMVLEINYTTPVAASDHTASFSEKRFFSVVNKKIQVNNQYKNYQLINQL